MNYSQTIQFLYSQLPAYHRIGKAAYKNDLDNSLALDEYFGKPHSRFRAIHIAGTNGKGSVSHMIASVLMEAGYRTGLYTSPHLKDFRERIRINGKMISKGDVIRFLTRHSSFLLSLKPSFFEMTVAMAFEYFALNSVDIAVIETGLGGRLDSTNIIKPVLSVITNIGHDHMDLLGDSLEKIAYEKAGIIKNLVPVVIGETQDESADLFIKRARDNGSEIFFADQNYSCVFKDVDYQTGIRRFSVTERATGEVFDGKTILSGDYQSKNIQVVFQSFRILQGIIRCDGFKITEAIRNTVSNTCLRGRWQIIGRQPLIICDTGHNREGLEYVIRQLNTIPKRRLHIVVGFVSDKDLGSVLPVFPSDAVYYFTKASVPRALDEEILMAAAGKWFLTGSCYPDVKSAVAAAKENATTDDLIFIGGSTFVVAEAI